MPDEAAMIRAAREQARADGELHNFRLAARVVRQSGYAVQPEFVGQAHSERTAAGRQNEIYDELLAAFVAKKGKATSAQATRLFEQAGQQAQSEKEAAAVGVEGGRARRSSRRRR